MQCLPQNLKHHLRFCVRNSIANFPEIYVLLQQRVHSYCFAPPQNISDFKVICVLPQCQRFFSITSASGPSLQWCHKHQHSYNCCQVLTYVMISALWLERLPGSIFLQAFQKLPIFPPNYEKCGKRNMKCAHGSNSMTTKTKDAITLPTASPPPPTYHRAKSRSQKRWAVFRAVGKNNHPNIAMQG